MVRFPCRYCKNLTYSKSRICRVCNKKNLGINQGAKTGVSRIIKNRIKFGYGIHTVG